MRTYITGHTLTEREKRILGAIVHHFIDRATPVSSTYIAQREHLDMSPATIRNIMASLEEKQYIYQPHPSAGRVPTSLGYRVYVNELMKKSRLALKEREIIRVSLQRASFEIEAMMREATRILAELSHQLGVGVSPTFEDTALQRLEIFRLSTERILLLLSLTTGQVKTITIEVSPATSDDSLRYIARALNERLSGMKLTDIRRRFYDIVYDLRVESHGLLEQLKELANRIFDFEEGKTVFIKGTQYIVEQPEFSDKQSFTFVAQLLEDEHQVLRLISASSNDPVEIKIGEELNTPGITNCSVIIGHYQLQNATGYVGIIGPTRMNYSKLVPLVEYTAQTISQMLQKKRN